jgi:hypothetical protein
MVSRLCLGPLTEPRIADGIPLPSVLGSHPDHRAFALLAGRLSKLDAIQPAHNHRPTAYCSTDDVSLPLKGECSAQVHRSDQGRGRKVAELGPAQKHSRKYCIASPLGRVYYY